MHYPDLTPIPLPQTQNSSRLIAVGWLEHGCDYQRGDVEHEFVAKLCELLANPWRPFILMGRHSCDFCRLSGGPTSFRLGNQASSSEVMMGVVNLYVPGEGCVYFAPSLILHYMDSHEYSPPDVFKAAVMACPTMRSMEYLKALLKNGPKELFASAR